ncbi:MAG TPA: 4-hydroxy-tetrahydrodipicolinate reductase [Actinomycetota bacterium]|jgi:4-hydroxy-tetrahydrodipicolinate reductase|nr:4-hydroxy-tetrahydrodipicolinate reductase [Actinomycetota bacterium]
MRAVGDDREGGGAVRVGVLGATGRMGRATCRAVLDAADLELVAAVARATKVGHELREVLPEAPGDLLIGEDLSDLVGSEVEVVVDFSAPEATMAAARALLPGGIHLVSGTTGLPAGALEELAGLAGQEEGGNLVWAPNFALGAVLAMHFAAIAARHFPSAEVIELHHAGKADAPSGTALRTAKAIAAAQGGARDHPPASRESVAGVRGGDVDGVRVHSVRLPGLVAHQEVVFGGQGEILTVRHDSLDLASFMPGVLLAVRHVPTRHGLTVGLEPLLGLS